MYCRITLFVLFLFFVSDRFSTGAISTACDDALPLLAVRGHPPGVATLVPLFVRSGWRLWRWLCEQPLGILHLSAPTIPRYKSPHSFTHDLLTQCTASRSNARSATRCWVPRTSASVAQWVHCQILPRLTRASPRAIRRQCVHCPRSRSNVPVCAVETN